MKKTLLLLSVAGLVACNNVPKADNGQQASAPAEVAEKMAAPDGGKQISDELIGIFFEDISSSADGGLNAELVQNGSFEFNANERDGWGPSTCWKIIRPGHSLGMVEAKQQKPIHPNNPNYLRLKVERSRKFYDYKGWVGYGLQNDGWDGMRMVKDAKYDFSIFARNISGDAKDVRIVVVKPGSWSPETGPVETQIIAEDSIVVADKNWKQYNVTLTAVDDCPQASLQILVRTNGEMDIDMVSLIPQDTYKGHGIRKDLAEALEALNPKFMRFPGGCVVHGGGDGFWNTYRWKNTVGPKETRKQLKNTWGYHQSMTLGYYEYFQLCEDMGMQPVPILPCGVNCQGTNGGWGMYPTQAQDACDMSDMDEWTQDALDLIEWANGDATTKWGKVRADAGHPAPFGLKYLGIGNEEKISPEFEERFKYMYNKIMAKYPNIIIVGTDGPGSHAKQKAEDPDGDYENGWRVAEELGMPIIDEHYYEPRSYYLKTRQYDSYPRDRKTKVYLGEYSAQERSHGNQLGDALAEALYLIHVERNADVVVMTSYAPLFARKGATNWNPDLIYYDNERPFLTCSYYVQQIFGQSSGNYYYDDCVTIENPDKSEGDGYLQEQSVVLNTKTCELFVKVCNVTANEKTAKVDLSRFTTMKPQAEKVTLKGNQDDENNYDQHPVSPVTEQIEVSSNMTLKLAPYSLTMLKIKL